MSEHLYGEGTSTFGLTEGYRLKVTQELGTDSPLTWNDEETEDGWAYRQWAAGEVYFVEMQREKVYVNPDDDRDIHIEWVDVDDAAIGNNYLTPADVDEGISRTSALDVAREHGWPGAKPVEYRVEKIGKKGNRTLGAAKPSILEAVGSVVPDSMTMQRRYEIARSLDLKGRAGHVWTDYVLHRQGEGA